MKFRREVIITIYDDQICARLVCRRTVTGFQRHEIDIAFAASNAWTEVVAGFVADTLRAFDCTRVILILGVDSTQVRTLDGLPQSSDVDAIRRIIAAAPLRYAPQRFRNTVVSSVIPTEPGEVTVAFVDLDIVCGIVAAIINACGVSGANILGVSVASDAQAMRRLDLVGVAGEDLDRMLAGTLALPKSEWRATLNPGGETWKPHLLAIIIAATLLLIAALSPEWQLIVARKKLRTVAHRASTLDVAVKRKAQLDSLRGPLMLSRSMALLAIHPLVVLDEIGNALGGDGHVTSFEADSTAIRTAVVTKDLVPFLRRLERNPQIADVAIIGGINHDSADAGIVETATISFRWMAVARTHLGKRRSE